jgi:hypothetical protein
MFGVAHKIALWKGDDDRMISYPDGTLLKASGPEIDRMEAGRRRWIPDPPTFNCMGLNWNAVQTISDSEWSQIPKGTAYPSRADGTLLQGSGPQVYVMTSCQRHWIPDPDTFNALGYNWNAIQHIANADLIAIPEGAQVPSKVQQPTTTDAASPAPAQPQGLSPAPAQPQGLSPAPAQPQGGQPPAPAQPQGGQPPQEIAPGY